MYQGVGDKNFHKLRFCHLCCNAFCTTPSSIDPSDTPLPPPPLPPPPPPPPLPPPLLVVTVADNPIVLFLSSYWKKTILRSIIKDPWNFSEII